MMNSIYYYSKQFLPDLKMYNDRNKYTRFITKCLFYLSVCYNCSGIISFSSAHCPDDFRIDLLSQRLFERALYA